MNLKYVTRIDFMGPKYGVSVDKYDGWRVWVMGMVVLEDGSLSRDINKAYQFSTIEDALKVAEKHLIQDDIA